MKKIDTFYIAVMLVLLAVVLYAVLYDAASARFWYKMDLPAE